MINAISIIIPSVTKKKTAIPRTQVEIEEVAAVVVIDIVTSCLLSFPVFSSFAANKKNTLIKW